MDDQMKEIKRLEKKVEEDKNQYEFMKTVLERMKNYNYRKEIKGLEKKVEQDKNQYEFIKGVLEKARKEYREDQKYNKRVKDRQVKINQEKLSESMSDLNIEVMRQKLKEAYNNFPSLREGKLRDTSTVEQDMFLFSKIDAMIEMIDNDETVVNFFNYCAKFLQLLSVVRREDDSPKKYRNYLKVLNNMILSFFHSNYSRRDD